MKANPKAQPHLPQNTAPSRSSSRFLEIAEQKEKLRDEMNFEHKQELYSLITSSNNLDKEKKHREEPHTLLSRLSRGSLNDRLQWIFTLYDLNGDGCITRQEMTDVVQAVYDLMGKQTDTPVDEQTVGQKVEMLFTTLDLNKDGVITLDEFTEACARDSTIVYNIDAMLHCDIAVLNSSDVSSDVTSSDPPPRAIRR
nr:visinin-like protein 1 [Penaeus vannamei]